MRSLQSFRYVLPAALLGAAICVMLAAVAFTEPPKVCRASETMPAEDGGPDWTRWVEVPCEKPPSSARVETRINPNPVDVDREAVEGRWR